jgi:hypothetical protein
MEMPVRIDDLHGVAPIEDSFLVIIGRFFLCQFIWTYLKLPDPFFVYRNFDDDDSNHIFACLLQLFHSQLYERISGRS